VVALYNDSFGYHNLQLVYFVNFFNNRFFFQIYSGKKIKYKIQNKLRLIQQKYFKYNLLSSYNNKYQHNFCYNSIIIYFILTKLINIIKDLILQHIIFNIIYYNSTCIIYDNSNINILVTFFQDYHQD